MDKEKRLRLEAAGFKVGSVEEFLQLSQGESALVELRLSLSRALKSRRRAQNITQTALARKLKSSQSRVAKIEAGDPSVSLDLMARAFLEIGASRAELAAVFAEEGENSRRTGLRKAS